MQIIFEFIGGFKDGETYVGDTEHGPSYTAEELEAFNAVGFYEMSGNGTIGKRFMGLSDHSVGLIQSIGAKNMQEIGVKPQKHTYEVFERLDGDNEVLIRARYIPPEPMTGGE